MKTDVTQSSLYRPDIDGLRAVAVVAVVLFHAFPRSLPGGFVGVDIFFVISGFLISGVILHDLDRNRFTFSNFYTRRIKRIFPALVLVLVSCLLAGWFLLFADEYAHLGMHTAAGAGFISNFALLAESGYFDASSETKPLLHLWSLSIEEQFYLLWPLLLFWIRPRGARQAVLLVAAGLMASLAFSILRVGSDQAGAFYLSIARFWELLIGVVLTFLCLYDPAKSIRQRAGAWLAATAPRMSRLANSADTRAWAGLGLIVIAFAAFDQTTVFPGMNALLPTGGAFLLISAGPAAWINRTVLAQPGVVFIGLISYPLYLWHWPLLTFLRIAESGAPTVPMLMAAVLASFGLAFATYRFVEKPIRSSRGAAPAAGLALACIAIAGAALYVQSRAGLAYRHIEEKGAYDVAQLGVVRAKAIRYPDCHFGLEDQTFDAFKAGMAHCLVIDPQRRNVLVIGDSHAADLYSALSSGYPDVNFLQATGSGCHPIEKLYAGGAHRCGQMIRYIKHEFAGLRRLDGIVLNARWRDDFRKVMEDVRYYRAQGIPVLVFGPTAEFSADVPKIIRRLRISGGKFDMDKFTLHEVAQRDAAMKAFFRENGVPYVSKIEASCTINTCPVLNESNEPLILDYGHWTRAGAVRFGRIFARNGALENILTR